MNEVTKVFIVFVIPIIFVGANLVQLTLSLKKVSIEGEITDYEIYDNYMILEFNDKESYRVGRTSGFTDFTVNSKLVVKLASYSWWLLPNTNNEWRIISILKMPDID